MVDKRKRTGHPATYTTYEPSVENIERDIRQLYENSLNNYPVFQSEQVDFDVQRAEDGVLEKCERPNTTYFPILALINSSVENPNTRAAFRFREIDMSNLNLYVFKFSIDDTDPVYIIRRFSKFTALNRNLRAVIRDNSFSKMNEQVWGFEPVPDLILWGDEALIISRYALTILCEVEDYYLETATALLRRFEDRINNFDELLVDCMEDRRTLKRLVKLAERPTVIGEVLAQEQQVLQDVIDTHALTLTFTEEGELHYRGEPGEAAEIVHLLADAYFVSSALSQPGLNP